MKLSGGILGDIWPILLLPYSNLQDVVLANTMLQMLLTTSNTHFFFYKNTIIFHERRYS